MKAYDFRRAREGMLVRRVRAEASGAGTGERVQFGLPDLAAQCSAHSPWGLGGGEARCI